MKWLQSALDRLIPLELRGDPERLRRFRLVVFSTLVLIPVGLLFVIQRLLIDRRLSPTVLALSIITLMAVLNPVVLRLTRSSLYPGLLFSLELIVFMAFTAFYNGGIHAPALVWAPAVPLLAVLIVGPRTGLFVSGLLVGLLVFYRALDQSGYPLPQTLPAQTLQWIHFVAATTLILFVALLAWYYETSRRRALKLAQDRLEEMKRLNQELLQANQKAEEASRAQNKFLTHINHELRTPLHGVIGVTSSLRQTELTPVQQEQVDTIHLCGENLLEMINNLLDLSRMEAGRFVLEQVPFDLQQVLHDVILLFKNQAEQKKLRLHSKAWREEPVWLVGDAARLRQILINLVGNAIKFTEEGEVSLEVDLLGEESDSYTLQIDVKDTGIGIAPQALQELFQPFVQVDHTITREYGGSGLGLSICQELITLMGGSIQVKSEPGKGSHFRLLLPFPKAEAPAMSAQEEPSFRRSRASHAQEPASILVVEDNPVNQKVATFHLKSMGHRVQVAHNGREAVELCKEQRFDVILMDCEMPEMDGYTAAQKIRAMESDATYTPIIALSAHSLKSEVNRALEAGMDAHLSKPFRAKELQAALAPFLS